MEGLLIMMNCYQSEEQYHQSLVVLIGFSSSQADEVDTNENDIASLPIKKKKNIVITTIRW